VADERKLARAAVRFDIGEDVRAMRGGDDASARAVGDDEPDSADRAAAGHSIVADDPRAALDREIRLRPLDQPDARGNAGNVRYLRGNGGQIGLDPVVL